MRRPFRFTTRFLFFMTAAVGLLVFAAERLFGPVIPRHVLQRVQDGMSKEEVHAVLGPPQEMSPGEWQYGRAPNPGWVEIWFDRQGRVSSINDESAFRAKEIPAKE